MNLYALVKELCQLNPADRLPAHGPEFVDNVRHHIAYKDVKFNWDKLKERDLSLVVFKPDIKDAEDHSNFYAGGNNYKEDQLPPSVPYDAKNNPGDPADWTEKFMPSAQLEKAKE